MKRREFVEKLGVGSAGLIAGTAIAKGLTASAAEQAGGHDHEQIEGPRATAVVSFGQWKTPLSRVPNPAPPPSANQHLLLPYVATIQAGGSVTFIVAGLHQVLIYAPGTTMTDIQIDAAHLQPVAMPPPAPSPFPPLINDPTNRVYRGVDPTLFPLDRVEAVTLAEPGTYLVVCGFLPHFLDNMHGFVKVLPR